MSEHSLQRELLDQLNGLPLEKQRQVLDFARALARAAGTAPCELLRFGGAINPEDLIAMSAAIQEGCE
jgi:hypothetical protein